MDWGLSRDVQACYTCECPPEKHSLVLAQLNQAIANTTNPYIKPHLQEFSLALEGCPAAQTGPSWFKYLAIAVVLSATTFAALALGLLPLVLEEEDQPQRWGLAGAGASLVLFVTLLILYLVGR